MEYPIRNVLYATDLGPHGPEVARHAAGLAQQFQAKIHVTYAVEPISECASSLINTYMPSEVVEAVRREGYEQAFKEMQRRLKQFCEEQNFDAGMVADMRVVEGKPAQVILNEARRVNADVIVLGSHGHSALGEMLIGSVAHTVTMKSPVPVLLVPVKRE